MSADSRYSSSPSTMRVPPPKKHSARARKSASSVSSAARTVRWRGRTGSDIEHPVAVARGQPRDQRALRWLHVAQVHEPPVALVQAKRFLSAQVAVAAV